MAPGELFCVCQTPYDPNLFYIGCDGCAGWFHGACVNVTPEAVRCLRSNFVCSANVRFRSIDFGLRLVNLVHQTVLLRVL